MEGLSRYSLSIYVFCVVVFLSTHACSTMLKDLLGTGASAVVPLAGESQDAFVVRCAADPVMKDLYPDAAERDAACKDQYERDEDEGGMSWVADAISGAVGGLASGASTHPAGTVAAILATVIGAVAGKKHLKKRKEKKKLKLAGG